MKSLFLSTVLALSFSAFADHHEEDAKLDFPAMKEKVTKNLDERIAALQEHKSCVSAASSKEELKACREKMKAKRDQMQGQMEARKNEWKARKGKDKK